MNISELVIYRNLKHEDLFEDMAGLMGLGKRRTESRPVCLCRRTGGTGSRIWF